MTALLSSAPFSTRDDVRFLAEMNDLTRYHLKYCPDYLKIWPNVTTAQTPEELPFLHARMFKHILFRTSAPDVKEGRVLKSSTTTGAAPSRILLDEKSSTWQAKSNHAI